MVTGRKPRDADAVGMTKTFSLAGTALIAVAALGLTACSQSNPPAPSAADNQKMVQYAQCMQKYGINIPVPGEGEPAGGLVTLNAGDPKTLAAQSACARLAPAPQRQGKLDPKEEDRALKLAECLRTQGIKAQDPATGSVEVTLEDGVTYTQQQLVAAYTVCNKQVPAVSK
jgi:hypothetical protein